MVPSFNWTNAELGEFKHKADCPSESLDQFTLETAKKFSSLENDEEPEMPDFGGDMGGME